MHKGNYWFLQFFLVFSVISTASAAPIAVLDFGAAADATSDIFFRLGGSNSVVAEYEPLAVNFQGALANIGDLGTDAYFTLSGVNTIQIMALGVPINSWSDPPPNIVGGNFHGTFTGITAGGVFSIHRRGELLLQGTLGEGELNFSTVTAQGIFRSTGPALFTDGTLLSLVAHDSAGLSLALNGISYASGGYDAFVLNGSISGDPVPEPGTVFLLTLGGVFCLRRKKSNMNLR